MWEKIQSPVQIPLTSLKLFGSGLITRIIAETVVRLIPEGCKMPFQNVWSQVNCFSSGCSPQMGSVQLNLCTHPQFVSGGISKCEGLL